MAIATRVDSFVAPTLTQQSIYEGIKTAFSNAGYSVPFDEYTVSTDRIVVYAIVLDNTKTYGTTYLRIRVTAAFTVNQQLYATWVVSTHTGGAPSTELNYTALPNNVQVNFVSLNGGVEYKLIMLVQGAIVIVLGYIAPTNKPVWWDLNAWNYCFIVISSTFETWRTTTLNPYANTEHNNSLNVSRMGNANPQTNRRDLVPGILVYTVANQGISGRTSDDLVTVAANGTTRYDTVQIPGDTKEYLLLYPASGGLTVRIS